MLILKRNFLEIKFLLVLLVALLGWFESARPQAAPRAPDAVAAEFYGWYLETLAADRDPLSDGYERFSAYVARDLAGRLLERLRRGELPASDYFLQAEHYHGSWLRQQVRAVTALQRKGRAEVVVTLGEGGEPRRQLLLVMVLEGGAWKIRHVNPAGAGRAGSSSQQPVI